MWELIKAAVWKYLKLKTAETIYDIRKEIRKLDEENISDSDKPKMEGGLHVTTDFEHPHMLGRENEIFGFGFTSSYRKPAARNRNST